jgi:hypothetical protein
VVRNEVGVSVFDMRHNEDKLRNKRGTSFIRVQMFVHQGTQAGKRLFASAGAIGQSLSFCRQHLQEGIEDGSS